ncbi:MAG: FliM/FliN family flagellar motor switch protein [Firmicutes bacterium]|nr:FliM/FliN family flagellar motor switch protein [Bacillota bacterium]
MNEEEIRAFLNRLKEKKVEVKRVQYPELSAPPGIERMKIGIDYLGEIMVWVEAQLGRATVKIRDILALQEGSVLELERAAGESADVLVNHQPFARGEVVVIGNNFGIRIDSILEAEK